MVIFEPSNIVSLETKNFGKHPGNHFHFPTALKVKNSLTTNALMLQNTLDPLNVVDIAPTSG